MDTEDFLRSLIDERERRWQAELAALRADLEVAVLRAELVGMRNLVEEKDLRYDQRFISSEKAVKVAEDNSEKWRANANEWRAAMDDKDKNLPTRIEVNQKFDAIDTRVSRLEKTEVRIEGSKTGSSATWALIVAALGGVGLLFGIIGTAFGIAKSLAP